MPEIKEFQEIPADELVDELYELGKRARVEYGEKALSDFLITLAFHFKTKVFQLATLQQKVSVLKALHDLEEADEDELGEEIEEQLSEVFDKQKVH